ncbi:hypothetical protein ACSCBZ_04760 [Streptomyces niveiscabiei]|uniref:hypothetical protein n=1 Tax=Streptomyces TaxID=1883 RepID=UPI0006EB8921|nr:MULTISPECIES: hypothetical protein [Streptomyces]
MAGGRELPEALTGQGHKAAAKTREGFADSLAAAALGMMGDSLTHRNPGLRAGLSYRHGKMAAKETYKRRRRSVNAAKTYAIKRGYIDESAVVAL